MMDFSSQHIPYNRELFAFLPREEMSVSHGHGDILVTHELLQLHERDLAGLSQPRRERMPHGVQSHGVQAVAIFRGQIEFSDGGLETGGRFLKSRLLAGLLKDRFRRFAFIGLEHPDHIFRHTDEDPFSSFLDDIEAAGIAVHILPAQFENLRGTEAGSQREQGHVVQLRMPLFKVVQKSFGFLSGQKAQPFVIAFYHFPSAALGRQRIDAAPHSCGDSTIYSRTHERKDIVHGLPGQNFPRFLFGVGLSRDFFELCISGGSLQELRLEIGKQIRGQLDDGQKMNFSLEMGTVLAVMLVNVLPFTMTPRKISVHYLPNGNLVALNGIDASGLEFGKKLGPFLPGSDRANAFAVPADGFPVPLAFVVSVPEAVDFVVLPGSQITFGGLTEENTLKLGLYVFSVDFVAHMSNIKEATKEGKMLIRNLSKMDFQDKSISDNYLNLLVIFIVLLMTCDRERERERERAQKNPPKSIDCAHFAFSKAICSASPHDLEGTLQVLYLLRLVRI